MGLDENKGKTMKFLQVIFLFILAFHSPKPSAWNGSDLLAHHFQMSSTAPSTAVMGERAGTSPFPFLQI